MWLSDLKFSASCAGLARHKVPVALLVIVIVIDTGLALPVDPLYMTQLAQ